MHATGRRSNYPVGLLRESRPHLSAATRSRRFPPRGATMPAKLPPRSDTFYWRLPVKDPPARSLHVTPAVLALIHGLPLPLDSEIKAFALLSREMGWSDIPTDREGWYELLTLFGGTVDQFLRGEVRPRDLLACADGRATATMVPALTGADRAILSTLAQTPGKALTNALIERNAQRVKAEQQRAGTADPIPAVSERIIRDRVPVLIEQGLVARPEGTRRKGIAITDAGRLALALSVG